MNRAYLIPYNNSPYVFSSYSSVPSTNEVQRKLPEEIWKDRLGKLELELEQNPVQIGVEKFKEYLDLVFKLKQSTLRLNLFPKLEELTSRNWSTILGRHKWDNVTSISFNNTDISHCSITTFYFPQVKKLYFNNCMQLTKLNLTAFPMLDELYFIESAVEEVHTPEIIKHLYGGRSSLIKLILTLTKETKLIMLPKLKYAFEIRAGIYILDNEVKLDQFALYAANPPRGSTRTKIDLRVHEDGGTHIQQIKILRVHPDQIVNYDKFRAKINSVGELETHR